MFLYIAMPQRAGEREGGEREGGGRERVEVGGEREGRGGRERESHVSCSWRGLLTSSSTSLSELVCVFHEGGWRGSWLYGAGSATADEATPPAPPSRLVDSTVESDSSLSIAMIRGIPSE